jgi:rhodanese-related sulfurtransferase
VAVGKGYTKVYVYHDGIPGWAKAGYPFESTAKYSDVLIPLIGVDNIAYRTSTDTIILDIRPSSHFQNGHIKNAVNIDLEDLPDKIGLLPKDKRIVLVDHKGKLTLITGRYLLSQGFENVVRLDGGFNAWVKFGAPVNR